MPTFNKLNNITGWIVFAIATTVYALTIEPTASFWDCGEYIACAYKLMVPHPPGAPFFLLVGRFFTMFAGGPEQVAPAMNMMSALSSSFTILFLFWTIVFLARKLLNVRFEEPNREQTISILGSAVIGSLAFTFSDSFWFNATEGEVYAMSAVFTAFVFWAILKWENIQDEQRSDKWLLLIAYVIGLSTGVHLLNLTAIPALALVFYLRKYPNPSVKGGLTSLVAGGVIILIIMWGIIQGLPSLAAWFELQFVNSLGMSFGSGVIVFIVLITAGIVYGIRYTIKHQKRLLNVALLSVTFILIGYSCYALIVIRSSFDPPIDENDPGNVMSFVSYLKREQYGSRPLIYGPVFTAQPIKIEEGDPKYKLGKDESGGDEYIVYDHHRERVYSDEDKMLFPRMYSKQSGDPNAYRNWADLERGETPDMIDNINYFWKYQLGFMYGRYFMWNFAGRQNDIQGHGSRLNGNWLSGIDFIDENFVSGSGLGPQDDLPERVKNNKARNTFYLLPFLLGVIGLLYQFMFKRKDFLVVGTLFFFTGIGVILFLNQPPIEPRERDYTHIGSFYAFAIWIGIGVLAIKELIRSYVKNIKPAVAGILSIIVCSSAPGIMWAEGWDDSDRSNRYHSVDSAKNMLNSCAENAILFTGGDNDTFPVWFAQEVLGFRTDVRVCNLSLLNTDWYISQMKNSYYESEALPISLKEKHYRSGINDYIPYQDHNMGAINLRQYVKFVRENRQAVKAMMRGGEQRTILPSKKFALPLDKKSILQKGFIPEEKTHLIPSVYQWKINKGNLLKRDLVILDMIAQNNHNNWERPIYFSSTLSSSSYLGLKKSMQQEGLSMRLLPLKHQNTASRGGEDIYGKLMYKNMMNNFYYRELDNPDVYYNEDYKRFVSNLRRSFHQAASALYREGKTDSARKLVNKCLNEMPDKGVPFGYFSAQFVPLLYKVGEDDKAMEMAELLGDRAKNELEYIINRRDNPQTINLRSRGRMSTLAREIQKRASMLGTISRSLKQNGHKEKGKKYMQAIRQQLSRIRGRQRP